MPDLARPLAVSRRQKCPCHWPMTPNRRHLRQAGGFGPRPDGFSARARRRALRSHVTSGSWPGPPLHYRIRRLCADAGWSPITAATTHGCVLRATRSRVLGAAHRGDASSPWLAGPTPAGLLHGLQAGPEDDDLEGGPVNWQAVASRAAQPGVPRPQPPGLRTSSGGTSTSARGRRPRRTPARRGWSACGRR